MLNLNKPPGSPGGFFVFRTLAGSPAPPAPMPLPPAPTQRAALLPTEAYEATARASGKSARKPGASSRAAPAADLFTADTALAEAPEAPELSYVDDEMDAAAPLPAPSVAAAAAPLASSTAGGRRKAVTPAAAQPRPRKARTGAPSNVVSLPVWRLTVDPSKTYVRGVLPAWLKAAMVASGLDPAKKEDREAFKAANMVREAA